MDPFLFPNPFFKIRLTPNLQQPIVLLTTNDAQLEVDSRREFEQSFSKLLGTAGGIAVNSGRSALNLALNVLNVKRGDEIIIPSLVCGAVVDAIVSNGAVPVLVDVKPGEGTLDSSKLRPCISAKTKAIIGVHYSGIPCDLDELQEIASKNDLTLIEDCAHSLGSTFHGKRVGNFGDFAFYSFGPDKPLTTGTGGFLTSGRQDRVKQIEEIRDSLHSPGQFYEDTSRRIIAENNFLRQKRSYGIYTLTYFPLSSFSSFFTRTDHSVQPHLISKFSSLVGIEQMKIIESILKIRIANSARLIEIFDKSPHLKRVDYSASKNPVFLRFVATTRGRKIRNLLMRSFKRSGIEAGPINWRIPLHRSAHYSRIATLVSDYDGADYFCDRFLNVPCHPFLNSHDFDIIERIASSSY